MVTHAMAMVRWEVFRPGQGRGRGVAVYDYGSDRKQYIVDYLKNLDWEKAEQKYLQAKKP